MTMVLHLISDNKGMEDDDCILVRVNSAFSWELESNPTTGFNWYIVSDEGLKIESEFINKSDLCGAPGIQVFKISSDKKGIFNLVAEYKRPWEDAEPVEAAYLTLEFI